MSILTTAAQSIQGLNGRIDMYKRFIAGILALAVCMLSFSVQSAAPSSIYKQSVSLPMDAVYASVYQALEEARFYVVFEPNIGKNAARFADKWGDEYNTNKLQQIRSMVFCNIWYANAVSNADPDMLALCPLRIGLYEKAGKTTVVFARPTVMAAQSAAKPVLEEVEAQIIAAIKVGVNGAKK